MKKYLALTSLVSFIAAVAIIVVLAPSSKDGDWLTQSQFLSQALNLAGPLFLICVASLFALSLASIAPSESTIPAITIQPSLFWPHALRALRQRCNQELRERMNA